MAGVQPILSEQDFKNAVAIKDSPVIIDCYATWCGPCKVVAPQIVKLSEAYPNARFFKVDTEEVEEVAQELRVRAMPMFVVFKNGEKVAEIVGAKVKEVEAAVQQHL